MYLQVRDNYWAIDIEGDPIPSTRVWCLCAMNIVTAERWESSNVTEIKQWIDDRVREKDILIGHNIIGYDAPTLNRICGTHLPLSLVIDTLVLSQLYSPSIDGGHSLNSWGKRLRLLKGDFKDFSKFSQEMLEYCRQDVAITRAVYQVLVNRLRSNKYSELGIEIEHRAWQDIKQQNKNGFFFNIKEAHVLYSKLREIENGIQERVHTIWRPELKRVAVYKRPYKKDGEPTSNYLRHCSEYESVRVSEDGDEYEVYANVSFNIGSPDQRIERLLALGWEPLPNELTPTGKPKPTSKGRLVPSLEEFVEKSKDEGPRLIAQWMEINARANMINTWIEAYNENTGCIHGSLWLANTLRYRHSNPNTANIPAVRVDNEGHPKKGIDGVYTYEARNLWETRDPSTRSLVGVDAKGIQLRVLAHYLNNPEFKEAVLSGDPHSYNQKIGEFPTRSMAKTFIYAYLLGAGDAKIGEIIGGSQKQGKEIKERFTNNFPGLSNLMSDLQAQVTKTNRIVLCDGTSLIVNQPHTRLGYLLQGDENRIMKMAGIYRNAACKRRRLDVLKVCDIHDEHQLDVLNEHVEEVQKDILPTAFRLAGERFNYRLPIDCDVKVGKTWAETH